MVGDNFGCGSSREHAVWGLKQMGIRALIGTTFAGIFYDNCQRNGVLIIQLKPEQIKHIQQMVSTPATNQITIDLPSQSIHLAGDQIMSFDIDPLSKDALLEGLDAIDSTLKKLDAINAFEQQHLTQSPWLL